MKDFSQTKYIVFCDDKLLTGVSYKRFTPIEDLTDDTAIAYYSKQSVAQEFGEKARFSHTNRTNCKDSPVKVVRVKLSFVCDE